MKILYFDCSSGISGNMTLGALLEITGDTSYLINELKKLNVDGYSIEISKKIKNGITGTFVDVILADEQHVDNHMDHEHMNYEHVDHSHTSHYHNDHIHSNNNNISHHHRNLADVEKIIDESSLSDYVKALSKRIFLRVAKAESKVHDKPLDEVHFHEVGAIDSIVDIVGTAILIDAIKPDRILSGVVNDGHGFIKCAHGTMSVPVPATSEIFAHGNVIFRQIDVSTELVTPTGAAIIAELATDFINLPAMNVKKIGWGAGSKDLDIPNILKVYYGDIQNHAEQCVVMSTNIDDCSGEILGYTMELLMENGARDVFYTPIYMKKNRPAYLLTVICMKEDMQKLENIIFKQTTTIGIRYRYENRDILERENIIVDTVYGPLRAKKVSTDDGSYIYPEYESAKKLAKDNHVPLKEIYDLQEYGK